MVLPEELRKVKGFSSIPPYLRVFPDPVALAPVFEQGRKNEKANGVKKRPEEEDPVTVENKRQIENCMLNIEDKPDNTVCGQKREREEEEGTQRPEKKVKQGGEALPERVYEVDDEARISALSNLFR